MLDKYLILSAILFSIGLYGALSRRNIIVILISIEIMFNAVIISAVAMARFISPAAMRPGDWDPASLATTIGLADSVLVGQAMAMFIIVVAAAEVALGLALVILLFRHKGVIEITELTELRH
jgi:NADH:ubiquinone oxidoreductase subunit K